MAGAVGSPFQLLSEIIRISNSTLRIDESLKRILEAVCAYFDLEGAALYVFDNDREVLALRASTGKEFRDRLAALHPLAECAKDGRPRILGPGPDDRKRLQEISCDPFVISGGIFPVVDDQSSYGILMLISEERWTPGEEDLKVLDPVTREIAGMMLSARLYAKSKEMVEELLVLNREKEVMVNELTNLFELNRAIMKTIDLDRLLHVILTAVTMGDGFGFNRAMLFLYNDRTGYLQGMMAVGPDTPEEAWKIWTEIAEKKRSLHDILEEKELKEPSSRLNEMVKGIRVSVEDKGILGLTVREKRAFNIADARNDPRVNRELLSKLGCRAFATVPLMASGRVIGVILVDNVFNERPITDDDIRLLTIFSNQAGMAIENSILYRNLKDAHRELKEAQSKLLQSEKFVALGEMAAAVAHEIRNPLVSIGGFARRLSRRLGNSEDSKYVDIISKEVQRLENILNDILRFSREEPTELELIDVNRVIDETLQFFWNDFESCCIEVLRELHPQLDPIKVNYHQLKQVFINLFANAKHTMESGGKLTIRSTQGKHRGVMCVNVEVSDTGGGIPSSIMANIFNPFFTTKDDGTGLGLAITHKIVTGYGGDIEVMNNDEGGATFIVHIPVAVEKNQRLFEEG